MPLEMLDWLSNDQRTSYAESSLLLDAPETPAPLFAYRALKSVLFGSHDADDAGEDEKENIPLETRSGLASTNLPKSHLKPKSLTPQRPTPRRMLSPAKSILRTPGIPTPRRLNASVKFKDIKQRSLNLSTIAEVPVIEGKANSPNSQHCAIASSEAEAPTRERTEPAAKPQISNSESQPEIYYNVKEIDAYIAATEHEMKKLVRYGQRMREYARLSQKENATLKRELDNVRKENAKLRRKEDLAISKEKAGHKAQNDGLFDLSPSKHVANVAAKTSAKYEPETAQQAFEGQRQHQPLRKFAEKLSKNHLPPNLIKIRTHEASPPLQPKIGAPVQHIPGSSYSLLDNTRLVSRTQLPPDRLAAAKARLRVKSEGRRKTLSMAEQVHKEDHGSSVVGLQDL